MEKNRISEKEWQEILKSETYPSETLAKAYGLTIENKIFSDSFFYGGEIALSFKNCLFEDKFSFSSYRPSTQTFLTDCVFSKAIYFGNISSEQKISFLDCTFDNTAVFTNINIPRLELNLRYAKQILFDTGSSYDSIQIGGLNKNKIDSLNLNTGIINKRFEINHVDLGEFHISYSTLESEAIIANCNIGSITFDNFRNNGFLKFLNCKSLENSPKSIFVINQSNMGKSEFFKFDFASFTSINITNSIILDCLFINSYWSKHNMTSEELYFKEGLKANDDSEKKVKADNLKEVFRQIKHTLNNQGDKVQEQFFHGLEMNQYDKTLSWKKNFWTKIILKLSFWTSDFGQSLRNPLMWIIATNSVLFFCLFMLKATKFTTVQILNFQNWLDTIASLLNFMNPLHKLDRELIGVPFIIDTFSRIFSSYFIYNIIRATRRFVR